MSLLKFGNKLIKFGKKLLTFEKAPVKWRLDTFYAIPDVYKDLKEGDKVSFVIRHGERNTDDYGDTGRLNDNGVKQAQALGKTLIGGLAQQNDIAIYATDVYRCRETASEIAKSRGDTIPGVSDFNDVPSCADQLNGHVYVIEEGSSSWDDLSRYAYGQEYEGVYNDLAETSHGIVDFIMPNESSPTLSVYISHDFAMVPLVVYYSQEKIDLRFYESEFGSGKWINFLSGIAVIKRKDGSVEICSVRGLDNGSTDTGYFQTGQPPIHYDV